MLAPLEEKADTGTGEECHLMTEAETGAIHLL